ncbi:hypothetical protein JKP88DRAFT_318258 [Tribonema minus]|uniref:Uncharacterized protein n=1 Tax=Tribonema minus TaxID=303371 RepID=A0A836CDT7_9STRA|nr:hypothetical protein JKP88DRAFT_318258 [Tribonema minus]
MEDMRDEVNKVTDQKIEALKAQMSEDIASLSAEAVKAVEDIFAQLPSRVYSVEEAEAMWKAGQAPFLEAEEDEAEENKVRKESAFSPGLTLRSSPRSTIRRRTLHSMTLRLLLLYAAVSAAVAAAVGTGPAAAPATTGFTSPKSGALQVNVTNHDTLNTLREWAALSCEDGLRIAATAAWNDTLTVLNPIVVGNGTHLTLTSISWSSEASRPGLDDKLPGLSGLYTTSSHSFFYSRHFVVGGDNAADTLSTADSGQSTSSTSIQQEEPTGTGLTLRGLRLKDGYAFDNNGGSVLVRYGTLHISGCIFSSNSAEGRGGAVSVLAADDITITDCKFFDNHGKGGFGGAITADVGVASLLITTCTFTSNSATNRGTPGRGGAVWAQANVEVESSTFQSNTAMSGGGCISGNVFGAVSIRVRSSIFTQCASSEAGGAIAGFYGTTIFNTTFNRCAASLGGAVHAQGGNMLVEASMFTNNSATAAGGALYTDSSWPYQLVSCTFAGNQAQDGGAVMWRLQGLDHAFTESSSVSGVSDINFSISDTLFAGNKALDAGGAVLLDGDLFAPFVQPAPLIDDLTVTNVTFYGNTAGVGGGLASTVPFPPGDAIRVFGTSNFSDNYADTCFDGGFGSSSKWLEWTNTSSCADIDAVPTPLEMGASFYSGFSASFAPLNALGGTYFNLDQPSHVCCRPGYFASTTTTCALCNNPGYTCDQACTRGDTVTLMPGYWRGASVAAQEIIVHECWNSDACHGALVVMPADDTNASKTAADGYCAQGYMGPYCAVCASGYASGSKYTCYQCTAANRAAAITGTIIAALVAVAAIMYLLPFWDVNGTAGALAAWGLQRDIIKCCGRFRVNGNHLRIPIIVIQLIGGFISITGLELAPSFETFIRTLSVLPILSFGWGCVWDASFYQRLLVMTLFPLVLVALLGISWLRVLARVRKMRCSVDDAAAQAVRQHALHKHWTAFLALTFLVYGTVSSIIFQTFACDHVQELHTAYLRVDYSIECYNNTEYWWYFGYAMAMMLVYPIGIPALYAVLVYRKRCHKMTMAAAIGGDAHMRAFSTAPACVPDPLRRGCDKSAEAGLGISLSMENSPASSTLRRAPMSNLAVEQLGDTTEAKLAQDQEVLTDLVSASAFLWAQYTPEAEWWELLECLRRILLTGALVFILPGSAGQAAVSMFMAFALLLVFMAKKPHKEYAARGQYLLGAVIVYMASSTALLIKAQPDC